MDKKLLQALDNLSYSLAEVANSLEEKKSMKSSVGSTLQSGDFSKQLSEISVSISKIKIDTESIIKTQDTILKIVKDSKDKSNTESILKNQETILKIVSETKNDEPVDKNVKSVKSQPSIVPTAKSIDIEQKKPGVAPIKSLDNKDKKPESFFSKFKDDGKKIKDSVGTIILIAGGILAIGSAFKIIGDVNWASVLALSVSLPLIAFSFSKISEIKMSPVDILSMLLVTVGISTAITSASYILSTVKPVGFFQATTSILIGGIFSALSFGIGKIVQGFKGISPGLALSTAFLMPIVLYAVSYSIAKSSELLSQVRPIGFFQATTAILIAGVFSALSFGIGKLISGFKGISPGLAIGASLVMPIVLVAISWSIYKSSDLLSQVKPIGFFQAVTAIMIAGVFTILSYGIGKMISGFKGINPGVAAIAAVSMPILLIALSASIMSSSMLLSNITPIGFFQALTAIMIAGVFVAISYAVKPLMKGISGVGYSDMLKGTLMILGLVGTIVASSYIINSIEDVSLSTIGTFTVLSVALIGTSIAFGFGLNLLSKIPTSAILKGSIAILAIATTISLSSMILSIGDYDTYPNLDWSLGVGASLLAFGLSSIGLGLITVSGIGAVALLAGAVATLGVAGLIVGVDSILSSGSYDKYPSLSWSTGIGASLLGFSTAVVILGAINSIGGVAETLSMGVIDNPIDAGISTITKIAITIPIIDSILSSGSYKVYPNMSWVGGISTVMTIFSGAVVMLGGMGLLGGSIFNRGVEAIRMISQSIVDSASILSTGKYVGGPSKDWADGITMSLSAFSPIYSILMKNSFMKIFGAGVSVDKFAESIRVISLGITTAANYFSLNRVAFRNGPPVEWSSGVSKSLAAFSPIYDILLENSGLLKSGITPDKYASAIKTIVEGISYSAEYFSNNKSSFENPPPVQWATGVGAAIGAFSPVYDILSENSSWFGNNVSVSDMDFAIKAITRSIISSANIFEKNNTQFNISKVPNKLWGDSVSGAISAFSPIFKFISDNSGWFGADMSELSLSIKMISKSIVESSKILSSGVFNYSVPTSFTENISKNIKSYVDILDNIEDVDEDEIFGPIKFAIALSKISDLIKVGSYQTSIPVNFTENISKNVKSYVEILDNIEDVDQNLIFTPIKFAIALSRISDLIKIDSYKSIIPIDFTENISKNIKSYVNILDFTEGIDGSDVFAPIKFLVALNKISNILKLESYSSSIPDDFTDKISKNIKSYLQILNSVSSVDHKLIYLPIKFVSILGSISDQISNQSFDSSIPKDFTENILLNVKSYIGISSFIDSNYSTSDPIDIIGNINKISYLISTGKYTSNIPDSYLINISNNIKKYHEISNFISSGGGDIGSILSSIRSINMISKIISLGQYDSMIPDNYFNSLESSISDFARISGIVKSKFDSSPLLGIVKDISIISKLISMGEYLIFPSDQWINGIVRSIVSMNNVNIGSANSKIVDMSRIILQLDLIFRSGIYNSYPSEEWSNGAIKSIIKFSDLVTQFNKISGFDFVSGLGKIEFISNSIVGIDKSLSKGIYEKYPNINWIGGIKESILRSGFMISEIDESLSLVSLVLGSKKSSIISNSVVEMSQVLSKGKYDVYPSYNWSNSMSKILGGFSNMDLSKDIDRESLSKVATSILFIDSKFKSGSFDKFPTTSWVTGTIFAIQKVHDIIKMLNFSSIESGISKIFGGKDPLMTALSNIDLLATSFEKLSNSVKSFTGGISSIDLDKLSAIRSLSNSVVLMSISDSDQFNRMMDRLEDRSGIFADILNSYNESKQSGSSITPIKIGSKDPDLVNNDFQILSDKFDKMILIMGDIASVAGSRGTLKSYLSSIKEDVNIGGSK